MGGVVGALSIGGNVISTAASLLGSDRSERKYYRSMAAAAEEQARQTELTAQRNREYMTQNAAYQSRQLAQDYSSLVGQQKTALAASGIGHNSATAQLILKTSRLNAELDQEMLANNLERNLYENNLEASLQAQQYRTQAKQYERALRTRSSVWGKLGSAVSGLLSSIGGKL